MEVQLHASPTAVPDGGEWPASVPARSTPRKRAPGTHRTGGWVDPRASLDAMVRRKISIPRWESNPSRPDRPVWVADCCKQVNVSAGCIKRAKVLDQMGEWASLVSSRVTLLPGVGFKFRTANGEATNPQR